MIGFSSTTGLFTVHSVDCKKAHCVKYFPKPPVCSCPSTGRFFHVIAVQMALRDNLGEDRASYSLFLLRKRHKGGERKSGRKKPRSKDCDYTVVPAPDAHEPNDRSILPTHSTPQKACTPFSPVGNSQVLNSSLFSDVSYIKLKGDETSFLQSSCLDCVKKELVHGKHVTSYPWLLQQEFVPAEVTDPKLECLENNGWLIEEIIEKLLRHFCSTSEGQKSVLFFDSFFV